MEHALITAALIYLGTSSLVGITGYLVTKESLDCSASVIFLSMLEYAGRQGNLLCLCYFFFYTVKQTTVYKHLRKQLYEV